MAPDLYETPYSKYNVMPNGNLLISYVYGYRCFDGVRGSAKYISDNRIVFI